MAASNEMAPVTLQVVVEAADLLNLPVPEWARAMSQKHRDLAHHDAEVPWYPSSLLERLYLEVMAASARKDLGLLLGTSPAMVRYGIQPLMIVNAPDMRAIIELITHYAGLTQDRSELTLSVTPHYSSLFLDAIGDTREGRRCREDFVMVGLASIFRLLSGGGNHVIKTCFTHPKPDYFEAYSSHLEGDVFFNAERAELIFKSEALDLKMPGADASIYESLKLRADMAMTERRLKQNCVEAVMKVISRNLSRNLRMADVAEQLHMHERTLRRQLKDRGTTYGDLLEQAQIQQAKALLCQPQYTLQDVAKATGYTNVSAFHRAFVRRVGVPAGQWRRHGATRD